jgi:hypothetical protein
MLSATTLANLLTMTIPLTCRFPGAHVPSPPHLGVKRSHQRRGVGRGSRDPTIANTSTRLSAENFFHRSPASTGLLRRAAETDREAANLLSVRPRNADGAILLVHLLG